MLICSSVDFFLQICRHIWLAQNSVFLWFLCPRSNLLIVDLLICQSVNVLILVGKIDRLIDRQIWILWTCRLFPRGKIEVSDSQGESLRKILYQAYDMTSFLKSVDMLTIQIWRPGDLFWREKSTDRQSIIYKFDWDTTFTKNRIFMQTKFVNEFPKKIDRSTNRHRQFGFLGGTLYPDFFVFSFCSRCGSRLFRVST